MTIQEKMEEKVDRAYVECKRMVDLLDGYLKSGEVVLSDKLEEQFHEFVIELDAAHDVFVENPEADENVIRMRMAFQAAQPFITAFRRARGL